MSFQHETKQQIAMTQHVVYMPAPKPPKLLPQQLAMESNNNKVVQNILPYIVISMALLASMFLLLSYYFIVVRNWSNWNRRRRTQEEGDNDENIIDHHINTRGLDPRLINLITVFTYKTGDGLIGGTECSVCLNEFQDNDSLKLLPKCNHAFHINCIDTWLRSHTNCPLCRAPIISNTVAVAVAVANNDDIGSQRDVIVQLNSNNNQAQAREGEFQENATDDQNNEFPKNGVDFDEHVDLLQQMTRSVSMDSSIATNRGLQMVVLSNYEGQKKCVETKTNEETSSNSRIQRAMDTASSSMKRSFSCGGRSFFSKNNRNHSSVLPL